MPMTGLSAYSALPSKYPVLNHVMRPNVATPVTDARSVKVKKKLSGFAVDPLARHYIPPKQVCYPTGYSFASSCSPPRFTATQLLSATSG